MDVEIITIGDEIITGHTIDTNSAFIGSSLVSAGFTIRRRTSVGDNLEDMEDAFRTALKRSQIIIATGGLGPTDDDITKRAITRVFKRNLIFHEDILEDIKKRFTRLGIEMPAINQNQALLPQGASLFANKNGSAVGICIAEQGRVFIALPGVPFEMRQILTDEVIPYLQGLNNRQAISVKKLRTIGIAESGLAELIKPKLKLQAGVKLAYLPAYSGVDLRVIARAERQDDAEEKEHALVRYLESCVGKYIYGRDLDTLESVVGQLLIDNDKTLSVAESCTAGTLGETITDVPGASRYFVGGILSYTNEVKTDLLKVDPNIINEHGAVSQECALAMAAGCRHLMGTDYALAITGIAGPEGGTDDKPVGTVYVGLASAHRNAARLFKMSGERDVIRHRAVFAALEFLRRDILDIE